MSIGMNLEKPAVCGMAHERSREIPSPGDLNIGIAGGRSRMDIKHIRLLPRPLHSRVRAPYVYGNSAVRRRVRTDKKHFHQ